MSECDHDTDDGGVMSGIEDTAAIESGASHCREAFPGPRGAEDQSTDWVQKPHPSAVPTLPQLHIEACTGATILLLAPFSTATVSNCVNCEIVIGAVSRVVHVIGCEGVKLTVASGKIMIRNCRDCVFSSASLSQIVISGDSRGLAFGPHNACYRHLRDHLHTAGLDRIHYLSHEMSRDDSGNEFDEGWVSAWSRICDVTTCLESPVAASSPTGYAIDAAGSMSESMIHRTLPQPPESTATILPPEKFTVTSIPSRLEYLEIAESPIVLPKMYSKHLKQQSESLTALRRMIGDSALSSAPAEEELPSTDDAISGVLTNSFLDWLVLTGKAQKVIDLIKIDGEKQHGQADALYI